MKEIRKFRGKDVEVEFKDRGDFGIYCSVQLRLDNCVFDAGATSPPEASHDAAYQEACSRLEHDLKYHATGKSVLFCENWLRKAQEEQQIAKWFLEFTSQK
jgi:hypothetical protein